MQNCMQIVCHMIPYYIQVLSFITGQRRKAMYQESQMNQKICTTYSGKFGTGFCVYEPRHDTTNYCWVSYYIFDKE